VNSIFQALVHPILAVGKMTMQKSFSLFVLSLFIWGMLAPVLPVFEYFINYDYIVEVLCINKDKPELECDGKCYLKDQLLGSSIVKNDTSEKQLVDYRYKPLPLYFHQGTKIKTTQLVTCCSQLLPDYKMVATEYITEIPSPPPRKFLLSV